MLNLIIQTQYKENYAAHNEDYEHGVSEPYWKFKGGSSYLITDVDFINSEYLQGLVDETAFIHSYENPASMEYVLDWELIDEENLHEHIEHWETPYILEKTADGWTSSKFTDNGEDGYMRDEIVTRTQVWTYEQGNRDCVNYHVEFFMIDNKTMIGEKALRVWFESREALNEVS
jgi:hypothetical protein|tara:strand:- start:238 stop:759 length:522 start_codon:yes stop_codon:yes gene_type:complete